MNSIQWLQASRNIRWPERGSYMSVDEAMKLAISEAYKGATRVSPNPLVGSVLLDSQNRFVAAGHHEFFGGPHAEVNAMKGVAEADMKEGHLIVTLEPCAHEGKTPSCAKMIARMPLKKVTYGLLDPNPLVAGKGLDILRQAGIAVEEYAKMKSDLEEVCEAFLKNFYQKKVFSALKIATTLDGKTAEASGHSQWITNEQSRTYAHYLRATYDAVMVGAKTIQKDDPKLNIRHSDLKKENKVILLDRAGDVANHLQKYSVFKTHKPENIFLFASENANVSKSEIEKHAKFFAVPELGGRLDLNAVYRELWTQGIRSIMIESGGDLATSLINEGYIDRLHIFTSMQILGPGNHWSEKLKESTLSSALQLDQTKLEILSDNIYLTGILRVK